MSALATVARKSFVGKFTAKIDLLIGYFMIPLLMLILEILKSLHKLSLLIKKNEICLCVCLSGYTFRHALIVSL